MAAKDKNTFYEGTGFERKMIVIRTDFYERIRSIADADPKRRLKAGEVMEMLAQLAFEQDNSGIMYERLEEARAREYPATKADLKKQFANLTVEQQMELLKGVKE